MRLNRTALRVSAGIAIFAVAAVGVGLAVDAQSPMPLQPGEHRDEPRHKPPARPQKPRPKPEAQAPANRIETAQPNSAPAAQPGNAAAQLPPSVFDQHAAQGNIKTCAKVFGVLGRLAAADSQYTAQTQWDSNAGNDHSVQSLVALQGGAGNPAQQAAGVVFAAPIGQSCEGTLVRVTPTNNTCQAVAAELGKLPGKDGTLGNLNVMTMNNGMQIMLVPFGDGCVAVTTLRASG
jgi:hypothetical protein